MMGSNNSSLAFRIKFPELIFIVRSTLAEAVATGVNYMSLPVFIHDVLEIPRFLGKAVIDWLNGFACRRRGLEIMSMHTCHCRLLDRMMKKSGWFCGRPSSKNPLIIR
jgi:hypothetical protein